MADLEAHLPEEWWRQIFDSLYLMTDGDVVESELNTRQEIDRLLSATGLQPEHRILDLCCGQGRHALELARRGFRHVTGIDRSRYLVRLARKRAREFGVSVAFREGDARTLRLAPASLDAVIVMGNSFGYFANEEDDRRVLEVVGRALRPSGTLTLDLTDGDWMRTHFEPRSWEWIDQSHFVCRERSLSADGARLVSREVIVRDDEGVLADQIYAERLYPRERIEALLESVGYRHVRFHGDIEGSSTRNQDLGMMARRLFVTASAPRREVRAPVAGPPLRVAVAMGDPRLPDKIKLGGQFNPEDLDTVERLKDALAELDGYAFRYLDNHATFERDLVSEPVDLVLNLCDEGWNNDAFMELHVPALLDMKGVPYTGSAAPALALCYDKGIVRAVAQALDVPTPLETYVRPDDQSATLPSIFPAILKPNYGDSSVGITRDSVVRDQRALVQRLAQLREAFPGGPVLVQEFLTGPEYSVGLIGNPMQGFRALPALEVDYSRLDPELPHILGYESKWQPSSPYWTQIQYREAHLPEDQQAEIVGYAMRLFDRLGCRDYARFDFRADADGRIKLLEVNPNPGWCWDGKMNLMAGFAGIRYAEMLGLILAAARERLDAARRGAERRARRAA